MRGTVYSLSLSHWRDKAVLRYLILLCSVCYRSSSPVQRRAADLDETDYRICVIPVATPADHCIKKIKTWGPGGWHLVQARTRGLSLPVSGSVDQARTSRRRAKSPVLGARGEARPGGNKGESNIVWNSGRTVGRGSARRRPYLEKYTKLAGSTFNNSVGRQNFRKLINGESLIRPA